MNQGWPTWVALPFVLLVACIGAAQDIANGRGTSCAVVVQVVPEGFKRFLPSSGFRCQDGVFDFTLKRRVPGFPR